jgi:hypothetical protein
MEKLPTSAMAPVYGGNRTIKVGGAEKMIIKN